MEYIYSMVSLVTTRINIYGDEKDVSFPPSQAGVSADQLEVLLTGQGTSLSNVRRGGEPGVCRTGIAGSCE